ncbi:OCIA domain-containing protein 1-like isoform X2 [Maniola jurtina]|uniref:OCIA domain-containing protein 1-like isoform X2 n=1 Tax=Maniola jurtina TaxID=191418 RepID=UPI001E689976|nr:OCIA domain-containing protein 1-like isoform X2 [Maniola jurtina]
MSDPNAFGLEDGAASGPARLNPAQYKFSQDELRVLKECNTESFYQRSLPLGTGFGLAAFFGVQGGHLKPNPRFGAFPKVTLAVIVGYFLGKLSYQQACAEKLMALPGSYIGQLLREKKEGRSGFPPPRSPAMFGASPEDIYSDAGPGSSLDLDMDRPLFGDDHYRAGQESGVGPTQAEGGSARPALSYDELRRRNRGEYSEARQDPYKIEPSNIPPIARAKPDPPRSSSTNKYGDTME